jgi:hypothetical protein
MSYGENICPQLNAECYDKHIGDGSKARPFTEWPPEQKDYSRNQKGTNPKIQVSVF